MSYKPAFSTLIVLCSIGLRRPVQSPVVVIGDFGIRGTIMKADNMVSTLILCHDDGAKKELIHQRTAVCFGIVSTEFISSLRRGLYKMADGTVLKRWRCNNK